MSKKDNKLTEYKLCFSCGFWVTLNDTHCPNCGKPNIHYRKPEVIAKRMAVFFAGIGVVISGTLIAIGEVRKGLAFILMVPFLGMGIKRGISLFGNYINKIKIEKHPPPSYLLKGEENIKQRLTALDAKEKHILEIKQTIIQESTRERLQPIITTLEKAIPIVQHQRKLSKVKLWRIELVRWLNAFKPLTANWYHITTQEQCDERLNALKTICRNGEKMLQRWNEQTDLVSTSEGKTCIENIKETFESCNVLIDELLAKKAKIAIEGIPIDESVSNHQVSSTSLDQIYHIMATVEVEKDEINKIEQDMQKELDRLESVVEGIPV